MDAITLEFDDNRLLLELCGPHDQHLATIEARLHVQIGRRGTLLSVEGDEAPRQLAAEILQVLYDRLQDGRTVENADVEAAIRMRTASAQPDLFRGELVEIRTRKKRVEPRTPGQKTYVRAMLENELVFGVGPAGTGKTYLAVAVGVAMLLEQRVERIILSRPAVEAGERLGFLPGDMKEKIDPYLQPLYDAIKDLWTADRIDRMIADGRLEVAPLAFMRGRTLSNAFVVLDEAQNATEMQMRMFLTRLGENSRMVITGDPSQIDLPRGVRSGLKQALSILDRVEGISIVRLASADVVRHRLVARIIDAYDESHRVFDEKRLEAGKDGEKSGDAQ